MEKLPNRSWSSDDGMFNHWEKDRIREAFLFSCHQLLWTWMFQTPTRTLKHILAKTKSSTAYAVLHEKVIKSKSDSRRILFKSVMAFLKRPSPNTTTDAR
jgi:hypothetical protein